MGLFLRCFVAAYLQILTLLEKIQEQQMQLAVAITSLARRTGMEVLLAEMLHNGCVPLAAMSELQEFEEWLKDARNLDASKTWYANNISVFFFHVFHFLSYILQSASVCCLLIYCEFSA